MPKKFKLFSAKKVPSLWLNFLIMEPDDPPLVNLNDFRNWIIEENDDVLVLDKPGWLVCHPSKNGPLSSLVGAAKEYLGVESIHLASRLDRGNQWGGIAGKAQEDSQSLAKGN